MNCGNHFLDFNKKYLIFQFIFRQEVSNYGEYGQHHTDWKFYQLSEKHVQFFFRFKVIEQLLKDAEKINDETVIHDTN